MERKGLTVTMIFLAESANYGEGIGEYYNTQKKCQEVPMSSILIFPDRQ